MKISMKNDRIELKFSEFAELKGIFQKNTEILQNFEFGAVQKNANLVDLEKC